MAAVFKKKKKKRKRGGGGALSRMHTSEEAAVANSEERDLPVVVTHGAEHLLAKKRRVVNSFGSKSLSSHAGAPAGSSSNEMLRPNMYESTRSAAPTKVAGGATASREIDTAFDRDAVAVEARRQEAQTEARDASGVPGSSKSSKEYKGVNGYTQWNRRRFAGPMRASSNVRTTARFDYDPSICKDYKETGTCGYGDSCIYLHDRSNYKSGWQLEQEWKDKERKRAKELLGNAAPSNDREEEASSKKNRSGSGLPFACFICRGPFIKPVVTLCKHFFCEKCALQRFGKKKKQDCAVCGEPTKGSFSVAHEIIADQKARREMAN